MKHVGELPSGQTTNVPSTDGFCIISLSEGKLVNDAWMQRKPQWIQDRNNEMPLEEARGEEKGSAAGRLRVSSWQKEINHYLTNADVIKTLKAQLSAQRLKDLWIVPISRNIFYNFY